MTETPYHETKSATYFKNADGSLRVIYKVKSCSWRNGHSGTIVKLSNDADGRNYLNTVIKKMCKGQYRLIYRCPNDGKPYSKSGIGNRKGHVQKNRAKVIDVRWDKH